MILYAALQGSVLVQLQGIPVCELNIAYRRNGVNLVLVMVWPK